MTALPRIAITLGDPAGIGPEIILKALRPGGLKTFCQPIVVGEIQHLERDNRLLGFSFRFHALSSPTESLDPAPDVVPVWQPSDFTFSGDIEVGQVQEECGRAAYRYILAAKELVSRQGADAICTAPIHKEAFRRAGILHGRLSTQPYLSV